ncbi:MAG: PAS domain-containing protein [Armatimonadetes bacterium]|nr:PAS domain-containing protein [Armatimonadota bacterium]
MLSRAAGSPAEAVSSPDNPMPSARERSVASARGPSAAVPTGALPAASAQADHGGHLARLPVLGGALLAAAGLHYLTAGMPHFIYVLLGLVLVVSVGMVLGSGAPHALLRVAVPLLDLAWMLFALQVTEGPPGYLLALLYAVVAAATVRGKRWESGVTLAAAITGTFALILSYSRGLGLSGVVAQISLLAASTLAVRLMAVSRTGPRCQANPATAALYEGLVANTSEALLILDPQNWHVSYCNPAAVRLFCGEDAVESPVGRPLEEVIHFTDKAFLKTCRKRLAEDDFVRGAVTTCELADGTQQWLTLNLTPAREERTVSYIQVLAGLTDETAEAQPASEQYPGYEFACHYIPALTHELNNHLAIIRLSAEVAAATGRMPDFSMIQQQVDHCQEVLQAVVVQVVRASTPTKPAEGTPACDLGQVIEHSLLLARPQVLEGGIELQLSLPDVPLPRVLGHVYELQEALVRIILQATEAMRNVEQPRLLTWCVALREGTVEMTLADLGPGLKWTELAAINGSAGSARGEQSAWRAIRAAITRSGGTLSASNGLNGGARFRITLKTASA